MLERYRKAIGETFNESEHLHFLDFFLAAAKEKTEKSLV